MFFPISDRLNTSLASKTRAEITGTRTAEGVAKAMNANQRSNGVFKFVRRLLLATLGITGIISAQTLPRPTIPPSPAILPASQTVAPGFDIVGFIQYASVDQMCNASAATQLDTTPGAVVTAVTPPPPPTPAGCKTSGGWLQVNGTVIRIPANTVVLFPNTFQTWEEVFEKNPGAVMCTGGSSCTLAAPVRGESGLAFADTVRPTFSFQAHLQGQIVNGTYMAGIVQISQLAGNGIQGFIEKLNYADGSMTVNGIRVQINDPVLQLQDMKGNLFNKGRYSIGQSPDLRFAADQNNSSIRSTTGFPMCIPRVTPGTYSSSSGASGIFDPYAQGLDDPQCPEINRPRDAAGNVLDIFTMNAPGAGPSIANPFPQDPYTEVPFEVGDFVTITGTQFQDAATGQIYISATQILDNLGVFTFPNTDPAYVDIDVLLQGTGGTPDPAFPQEAARRTTVEGFSTDPLRNVDISAVDIDACGNLTFRLPTWVSNFPVEQGLPLVGMKGRFRFTPNGGTFLPPVQSVGVQVSGGKINVQNNGLVYGYYQLPNPQFIFPEQLIAGSAPPSYNFQDLPFLVSGTGPWPNASSVFDSQLIQAGQKRAEVPQPQATQIIGQLNPWPDKKAAPAAQVCNTINPNAAHAVAGFTANANPVIGGTLVTLSAQGSFPQTGPYTWTQVVNAGDPIIQLINPNSATATFVAPAVSAPLNLTFQLTVGQVGLIAPASTTLLVPILVAPANAPPGVTGTATPNPVVGDGTSVVTLSASGVDPNGGKLTYTWNGPAGIVLTPTAADGSTQTFVVPAVLPLSQPQTLTFSVVANSSIAGVPASAATPVVVTVNPGRDRVTIVHARYVKSLTRLIIEASDFLPGVTLSATLAGPNGETPVINPATGSAYTGLMGPVIPFAQGIFSITFANVPVPALVTVTSSGGGQITSGVTITP